MAISKNEQAQRLEAFFTVQWNHLGKFLYKDLELHRAECTAVADVVVLTMTFTSTEPKGPTHGQEAGPGSLAKAYVAQEITPPRIAGYTSIEKG